MSFLQQTHFQPRRKMSAEHVQEGAASRPAQKPESPVHRKMWNSNGLYFTVLSRMEADSPTCYDNRRRLFH